jgi:hypothetical protein
MRTSRPTINHAGGRATIALLIALGTASAGCASLAAGDHDEICHFQLGPSDSHAFTAWTEISFDNSIDQVGLTTLTAATLTVRPPSDLTDLTFLESLLGEADNGTFVTPVLSASSFPKGELTVPLTVVYDGDLHPLFMNSNTIKIDWSGTTNPSYAGWPTSDVWMQADLTIDIH